MLSHTVHEVFLRVIEDTTLQIYMRGIEYDAHTHTHTHTHNIYKSLLSEVHKLLCLYLTVPVYSATAERTFPALRRLKSFLRSSQTEKRLNNCILLHVHKEITDSLDIIEIDKISSLQMVFERDILVLLNRCIENYRLG